MFGVHMKDTAATHKDVLKFDVSVDDLDGVEVEEARRNIVDHAAQVLFGVTLRAQ